MIQNTFEKEVCMYINDCMQYLKESDLTEGEFKPTENHEEIIEGLKELKDLCIQTKKQKKESKK